MPRRKRKPITPEEKARRQSESPTYKSWMSMRGRCYRPEAHGYRHYGGKGISVCERWRNSFANFLADLGPRPNGCTIDRIDNTGNYTPSNCRWSTKSQQSRNRSCARRVIYRGKERLLADLADESGHTRARIYSRLKKGWSVERAIDTPVLSIDDKRVIQRKAAIERHRRDRARREMLVVCHLSWT
jgi:hypothetical protein